MEQTFLNETTQLITHDLGANLQLVDQWELLRQQLTQVVAYLLQTDRARLYHYLYRIDVEEKRIKSAMAQDPNADMASLLANLIIERSLQTVKTRAKYRKWQEEQDADGSFFDAERW